MDAGSQVVADSMRITRLCSVWDVYANSLTGGSDVVPENSGPTAFAAPILPAPPFPAFACDPAIPHTVETGATEVFGPGTYGVVEFKDDAVVTLQPGIYTACELRIGKHVQVTTVTGIELRIARTFSLSNDSAFGPVCDVPVYVRADGASGDNDVAINFSKDTDVRGRFLTPTGKIALGNHTDLFGSFFGRRLISDANVNVTGCEGNENESSTSTSSTSTNTSTSTSTSTTSSSTSSTSTSTSTSSTAPSTSTTSASTSTSTTVGTSTSIGGRSSSIPSGPFTEPTPAPPVDPTARLPRTGAGGGGIEFGAALFTLGLALLGRARPRPQSRQPQS